MKSKKNSLQQHKVLIINHNSMSLKINRKRDQDLIVQALRDSVDSSIAEILVEGRVLDGATGATKLNLPGSSYSTAAGCCSPGRPSRSTPVRPPASWPASSDRRR